MANLNRVFLMGNLTRDPELRYTPSGTPICEFGLAVNRRYQTRDGEQRDETCFLDVSMWGKRGVVISEYFQKGRPIFIEGRLKYDSWEGQDGKRKSRLTVVAENFEFVGGRRDDGGGGGAPQGGGPARRNQSPTPRDDAAPPPDENFDVADDEIPF